jgi:hypothetical protein
VGWLYACRRIALCSTVLAFVAGVLEKAREHQGHEVLALLTSVIAFVEWCHLDARIHGKTIQHAFILPLWCSAHLALPVHLLWTRGWPRWKSLAVALKWLAVGAVVFAVLFFGSAVAYGLYCRIRGIPLPAQ